MNSTPAVVILAGGKSTRLPNKLLLPVPMSYYTSEPMILSSVKLAQDLAHGHSTLILSVGDDSIIQIVLNRLKYAYYQVSCNSFGVPSALQQIAAEFPHRRYTVLCGDNLYKESPQDMELLQNLHNDEGESVVVARSMDRDRIRHLATVQSVNEHSYFYRRQEETDRTLALSTPWFFTHEDMLRLDGEDIVDALNFIQPKVVELSPDGWKDVGTRDTYTRLWNVEA